jgi:predicted MFS family arabinose efflux permease
VWGVSATVGNVLAGRLTDAFGSRRVINAVMLVGVVNFALLPFTSAYMPTTIVALIVWGVCGWGLLVPQQHRLLHIFPAMGALLMSLNSAGIYLGVSASGVLGAFGITYVDKYRLGWIAACFIVVALLCSQVADRLIARRAALAAGAASTKPEGAPVLQDSNVA